MLAIIADSTSDLGPELYAARQIQVIPLYVNMGGKTYRDGKDMTIQDIFNFVQSTGQLPKTAAPSIGDFQEYFSLPGECIYIGISSQLSATIQNAGLARENYRPEGVYIIDSLNLSTGIGLLVLKAADLRDQGLSAREIDRRVHAMLSKVRSSFIIETLDYLHKGGRCSAMQSLASSLFHIRPVIAVRPDGTLGVKTKTRGARGKALQAMLDDFRENLPEIDLQRVFVTHTGCEQDAEFLKNELLKMASIENIYITLAGSVIASHCGPDTIGILYMLKDTR